MYKAIKVAITALLTTAVPLGALASDQCQGVTEVVVKRKKTGPVQDGVFIPPASHRSGGNMDTFAYRVNWLDAQGVRVEIPNYVKVCNSSCTLYVLAKDVCVGSRFRFGFHGPKNIALGILGVPIRGMDKQTHACGVQIFADNYNYRVPGLGDWFREEAGHKFGWGMTTLTGQQLHDRFGVELCPESPEVRLASSVFEK